MVAGGRVKEMIADTVAAEGAEGLQGRLPNGAGPAAPGPQPGSTRAEGRDEAYRRAEVDRLKRANPAVADVLVLGVGVLIVVLLIAGLAAGRELGWW